MPRRRDWLVQALLAGALVAGGWLILDRTLATLRAQGVAAGFGFLGQAAGFDIGFKLIAFGTADSYARAFVVALLNTLLVSLVSAALATVVGAATGILLLSRSRPMAALARVYTDLLRSCPVLLQIFFWYFAVLGNLPPPRQSLTVAGVIHLSNRGLVVPVPADGEAYALGLAALGAGLITWRWLRRMQGARAAIPSPLVGEGILAALLILGPPALVLALTRAPLGWEVPRLSGFNFAGGATVVPEFVALVAAMSIYASAFIAEIVRASIQAVDRGQREAALALGLKPGATLRLVVVPLALRAIVPPLANQYLTIIKYSSLAAAIGFPDLMAVFGKTALNHTGQAIEVLTLTTAVYLAMSLATAALMHAYNRRVALRGGAGVTAAGVLPWLRARLVPDLASGVATLAALAIIALAGPKLLAWAVLDATFAGASPEACGGSGACWPFVSSHLGQFVYGYYPTAERWRVDLGFLALAAGMLPLLARRLRPRPGLLLLLALAYPPAAYALDRGGFAGLAPVDETLWGGLFLTLLIAVTAMAAALPLGVLLALARRSRLVVLSSAAAVFIEMFRGVPLVAILFIAVVMLPLFLPQGLPVGLLPRVLIGNCLYAAAYMAEAVRGGLQVVGDGQREAARSLGLGRYRTATLVVLPQALRVALPSIVNTFIGLIKDTSLVVIVGVFDLLGIVQVAATDPKWLGYSAEGYAFAGAVYVALCLGLARLGALVERRMAPSSPASRLTANLPEI